MLIRDYQSNDFPQIEALWIDTGIFMVERGDTPRIIERCNDMGGKFLVMEDPETGNIVATSWLTWDGRRILLHHFAISPPFQNQGYGRTLALESLAFARERGYSVKLEVSPDNLPAIQLYRSLGFELLGDFDVYMLKYPS
ncbi:MAG: GNAT family N-acetyltransferase [Bacteroidia bacterium]|nr:MAG: GNAT family N-acetyltransferase [Bacteroidia bacterium]